MFRIPCDFKHVGAILNILKYFIIILIVSTNQNSCILLVVIKIILAMHGHMNIKFSGNFLPMFRYNQSVPSYPKPGDWAVSLA